MNPSRCCRSRKNAENSASEENIRQTAGPFHKIGEKAKEIQKVLAEIASDHLQLQANTSNLKGEVMKVGGVFRNHSHIIYSL